MNMTKTVHLMKELNDKLPEDERLEEFHVNIAEETNTQNDWNLIYNIILLSLYSIYS